MDRCVAGQQLAGRETSPGVAAGGTEAAWGYRGSMACMPPRVLPSKGRAVVTETSQEKELWEKGMGRVFSTEQRNNHSGVQDGLGLGP